MGERGPKPEIVQRLTPAERAELDEAIVEGSETKQTLYDRFVKAHGVSYRTFCTYAAALEHTSRHRYIGELLTRVFGNLPDSEIDVRARGIMMVMLDRIAADVLHDKELKPKDLRHVVQSYDILRKGTIAEAQEERRRMEWEVMRAAGIAEAAKLIRQELAREIAGDPELQGRLHRAVERIKSRSDKPMREGIVAQLVSSVSAKWGLDREDMELINRIVGVNVRIDGQPATAGAGDKPAGDGKRG